ncbi:MAG: uroporphyrinogen-III C-methyltransferase [Acidiferrobacterales bacterium]|nr:uroporphyrinogen-III C-methyltransferase [Acidiferrobacterales bacterium]
MAEESTQPDSRGSSGQSDKAKRARKPKQTSSGAKFWIFVALLLSLVSLGGAGYLFYQQEFRILPQFASESEFIQDVDSQISELTESISRQKDELIAGLQGLDDEVEDRDGKIERLESEMQQSFEQLTRQLEDVKASLSAIYENQDDETDEWRVQEIIFLMVLARHRIEIDGNVNSALVVWRAVEDQLQTISNPGLFDAKLAIEEEIAALENLVPIDLGDVSSRLLRLAVDVEQLPLDLSAASMLQDDGDDNAMPDQPVEVDSSMGSGLITEVWTDIQSLVRVKKIDPSEQSLLRPDMIINVVENLKSALFAAQSAAIRSDQQLFEANLEYVRASVGQQFSSDSSVVAEFSSEVSALIATDIVLDIPDLSRSIELLEQALESAIVE